jgi:DNA polymerase II large subunit
LPQTAKQNLNETAKVVFTEKDLQKVQTDFFLRCSEKVLKFMETLAVFESFSRSYLPDKNTRISHVELLKQLDTLSLLVGNRR